MFVDTMFIAKNGQPLLESLKPAIINFAVASVIKNDRVVSHIPKSVGRAVHFFLNSDGHSSFCEDAGRPTNRGVSMKYCAYANFMVAMIEIPH